MNSISFNINTTNKGLWRTLANNEYEDCMQPISEMIDNSIAAKSTIIKFNIDIDNNYGSIEDNGKGFPITSDELSRCFTYSPDVRVQTDLNEHGCGLKSSLAILDPYDSSWKVTWKNNGKIYRVEAPYSKINHTATEIDVWPGTIDDECGTIIEFPVQKTQFRSLYVKKDAKMVNFLQKLKEELSQYWMFHERFVYGHLKLYINDEEIKQLNFLSDCQEYIDKYERKDLQLDSGANVKIIHAVMNHTTKNKTWFRRTHDATGIYIYKNGRIIQRINNGQLYTDIIGRDTNTTYNGNIALVNIVGKQEQLPTTVPTKNKFKPNNLMFIELIEMLKKNISFKETWGKKEQSEEQLLTKFQNLRDNTYGEDEENDYSFLTKIQIKSKDDDNLCSPQLDALEINNNKAFVYEAKKDNSVKLPHINQLFCNWLLSVDIIKEQYVNVQKVIPILLIDSDTTYKVSEDLKKKINKLDENSKYGFPLEIRNFENQKIFKLKN